MNPILSRYVGFALAAVIAGAGGGYLAVSKKASPPPVTQSGTLPAAPAVPYPYPDEYGRYLHQGVRASPAIPALPSKPDKTKENPVVSYIKYDGLDFGFHEQNEVTPSRGARLFGTDLDPANNAIFWDNTLIERSGAVTYDGITSQMYFPVPADVELGSTHSVTVKNDLGISNAVQVRAIEAMDERPIYSGVRPYTGPVGTKVDVATSPGKFTSQPLSQRQFVFIQVPASAIKSGAEGYAFLFLPAPLTGSSFLLPKEWVYCPSYLYRTSLCSLASPDTKVVVSAGEYLIFTTFEYEFKYAGTVKMSPLQLSAGTSLGFRFKYIFGN